MLKHQDDDEAEVRSILTLIIPMLKCCGWNLHFELTSGLDLPGFEIAQEIKARGLSKAHGGGAESMVNDLRLGLQLLAKRSA